MNFLSALLATVVTLFGLSYADKIVEGTGAVSFILKVKNATDDDGGICRNCPMLLPDIKLCETGKCLANVLPRELTNLEQCLEKECPNNVIMFIDNEYTPADPINYYGGTKKIRCSESGKWEFLGTHASWVPFGASNSNFTIVGCSATTTFKKY